VTEKDKSFYTIERRRELLEDDEISPEEEGFMSGYESAMEEE